MDVNQINELIRKRRAIFPHMYDGTPIPKETIATILENANWAPTHKLTQPWRFKVIRGEYLKKFSEFVGDFYRSHSSEEDFSEMKYEKTIKKPLQSGCVIAVCMQRDPGARVPEWEEIAAVACAVQNMWLTATAYGIGAYWSSPKSIHAIQDFLKLKDGEHCLGYFYMGNYKGPELPGKRDAIDSKVDWFE